jgi:hypothetical protein
MDIRYIGMVAGLIAISGCSGQALDVGTTRNAGAATGLSSGGTAGASSGGTGAAAPAACDAGLSTGAGFAAGTPMECTLAPGTPHSVTSTNDVVSLLVGEWVSCGTLILPDNVGIQFTADGRFTQLTESDDHSLVPVGSPGVPMATAGSAGISGSTAGDPAISAGGTFSVVDGSSTYGPGTFELQLNPDSGGVFEGQITFTDSPRSFVFLYPDSRGDAYVPPDPWTPRANVCAACDSPPGGTAIDQNDPAALSADVVGRWLWCAGADFGGGQGGVMGVEFSGDGAWYWLVEALDGTLSRDTAPSGSGTFTFTQEMQPNQTYVDPGPYNLEFHTQEGDAFATQAVVTQNPLTLWYGIGISVTGASTWEYAYLSPLP